MTQAAWQEHFKSYIKNSESLYSKDTTDVSFLMFCLRSKALPSQIYLAWAKEHYQLPVLSEKFFQIHKPQQELYKKWQKVHKWSAECLPLAEWDGTLIIACLEKPLNYQHKNPTVFLLAPPQFLDQVWAIYTQTQHSADAGFTDMTALAATVVAAPIAENKYFDENGALALQDPIEDSALEEHSAETSESDSESPDGLFGENPPPAFSFDKLTPTSAELPPAPAVALKKGPRSVEPILSPVFNASEEKTTISATPTEDSTEHNLEEERTSSEATALETPPPPEPVVVPLAPGPAGSARGNINFNATAYTLEKVRKQNQEKFDQELQASFNQMKTFFKKSMLLAIGDKDRLLKPLLWDNGFDVTPPANPEINLKTPSIFRIVNGTQKPYHGYIVVNDLNEAFFESWNHGQIPDHVTLVPVMDKDQIVGMLMGLGEKSCYNKNVLQFTEDIAKKISTKVSKPSLPNEAA